MWYGNYDWATQVDREEAVKDRKALQDELNHEPEALTIDSPVFKDVFREIAFDDDGLDEFYPVLEKALKSGDTTLIEQYVINYHDKYWSE